MVIVIVPSKEDAAKILGSSTKTAHAARCGTCACKCACRENKRTKDSPW
jgi:hypothetical protein